MRGILGRGRISSKSRDYLRFFAQQCVELRRARGKAVHLAKPLVDSSARAILFLALLYRDGLAPKKVKITKLRISQMIGKICATAEQLACQRRHRQENVKNDERLAKFWW